MLMTGITIIITGKPTFTGNERSIDNVWLCPVIRLNYKFLN